MCTITHLNTFRRVMSHTSKNFIIVFWHAKHHMPVFYMRKPAYFNTKMLENQFFCDLDAWPLAVSMRSHQGLFWPLIACAICIQCLFWETKLMPFRGGGWWCSILHALNLERWGVKIHNCTLLLEFLALFWLYCMHALIF